MLGQLGNLKGSGIRHIQHHRNLFYEMAILNKLVQFINMLNVLVKKQKSHTPEKYNKINNHKIPKGVIKMMFFYFLFFI